METGTLRHRKKVSNFPKGHIHCQSSTHPPGRAKVIKPRALHRPSGPYLTGRTSVRLRGLCPRCRNCLRLRGASVEAVRPADTPPPPSLHGWEAFPEAVWWPPRLLPAGIGLFGITAKTPTRSACHLGIRRVTLSSIPRSDHSPAGMKALGLWVCASFWKGLKGGPAPSWRRRGPAGKWSNWGETCGSAG